LVFPNIDKFEYNITLVNYVKRIPAYPRTLS